MLDIQESELLDGGSLRAQVLTMNVQVEELLDEGYPRSILYEDGRRRKSAT